MGFRIVDGAVVTDDVPAPTDTPSGDTIPTPEALTEADGIPTCESCGKPNHEWWPGKRGRKPKYHEGCRPVTPNRSASSGSRSAFRNEGALREALVNRYYMLGNLLSMLHPAYAVSIRDNAERAADADIAYARVNPAFRKRIESLMDKTAAGEVVAVHVAMLAPIVVGEASKRARRKAEAPPPSQARTDAGQGTQPGNGSRERASNPPRPDNVTRLRTPDEGMPGETRGPDETVNAAAMPGMPAP
jgi:hypothetical protein